MQLLVKMNSGRFSVRVWGRRHHGGTIKDEKEVRERESYIY